MHDIDSFLSAWTNAELELDPEALDVLLTEDFVAVGPLGFTLSKPEWLARRSQGLTYETFEIDEVQTRNHGSSAIITVRQRVTGAFHGQPVPQAVRATLALVRNAGTWQVAGIHMSFIAGTPGAPPMPGATQDGR